MEVLWTLVNLVGAYYSILNYVDARASLRAAMDPPVDRVAVPLARMAVFVQRSLGVTQTFFVVLGCMWLLTPQQDTPDSLLRSALIIAMMLLAGFLSFASYRVKQLRTQAVRLMEEERHNGHTDGAGG